MESQIYLAFLLDNISIVLGKSAVWSTVGHSYDFA